MRDRFSQNSVTPCHFRNSKTLCFGWHKRYGKTRAGVGGSDGPVRHHVDAVSYFDITDGRFDCIAWNRFEVPARACPCRMLRRDHNTQGRLPAHRLSSANALPATTSSGGPWPPNRDRDPTAGAAACPMQQQVAVVQRSSLL